MPLGPTGHLLHKDTLLSLEDVADISNTQTQTQRIRQNKETKEYLPNK